jgi:hypothetical protein
MKRRIKKMLNLIAESNKAEHQREENLLNRQRNMNDG